MDKTKAKILLALVFAARGTSFIFSKHLLQDIPPMSILAVRFTLSFLILAVIFSKKLRSAGKAEWKGGLWLGVLYTFCMVMEMYGLRTVDTGVAALIENMAIVLVPICTAVTTGILPERKTMFCAVLAVIGVGFMSLSGRGDKSSQTGLIMVILAAIAYAVCIIATEKVTQDADPIAIGMIQLGTMGGISLILSLIGGTFMFPQTGTQWTMMLMLVLVCSCFGFAFQPVGQKYLPAETAAVFTVINPLTASIIGLTIAGEKLDLFKGIGYILILTALLLYNLRPEQKNTAS